MLGFKIPEPVLTIFPMSGKWSREEVLSLLPPYLLRRFVCFKYPFQNIIIGLCNLKRLKVVPSATVALFHFFDAKIPAIIASFHFVILHRRLLFYFLKLLIRKSNKRLLTWLCSLWASFISFITSIVFSCKSKSCCI